MHFKTVLIFIHAFLHPAKLSSLGKFLNHYKYTVAFSFSFEKKAVACGYFLCPMECRPRVFHKYHILIKHIRQDKYDAKVPIKKHVYYRNMNILQGLGVFVLHVGGVY